jgi:hypothetical protein
MPDDQPVLRFGIGLYLTYGGGCLLKFELASGVELVQVQSDAFFTLVEHARAGLQHLEVRLGSKPLAADRELLVTQEEDFDKVREGNTTTKWTFNQFNDGALWSVIFADATERGFFLRPAILAGLVQSFDEIIEECLLVDLRPYRDMSWHEMGRALERLPGFTMYQKMEGFNYGLKLFRRNTKRLVDHLAGSSGELSVDQIRWERRHSLDLVVEETMYCLFDFATAAFSLVNYSRNFYEKHYEKQGLMPDYRRQIETRFTKNGIAALFQRLRNLIEHVGLLGPSHVMKFDSERGLAGSFAFERDQLLAWDGWTSAAKAFLQSSGKEIDLAECIESYRASVEDFHVWFDDQRQRIHGREIRTAELIRRAVLARRGFEETKRLEGLLEQANVSKKQLLEGVSMILSAPDSDALRDKESTLKAWMIDAVHLARERYFISEELEQRLLDACDRAT